MTTTDNVTREQIEQLMQEAGEAGDLEQVRLCEMALTTFAVRLPFFYPAAGVKALERCVRAIQAAEGKV